MKLNNLSRIALFVGLVVLVPWAMANPIRVLTLDETRVGVVTNANGSINFNFVTGGGYETVRNLLLTPANFGTSGTVPRSVEILPQVSMLTDAALAGVDVVVIGGTQDPFTLAETAALGAFVNAGGGLLVFYNWAASSLGQPIFGATYGGFEGSGSGTVVNSGSPIASYPFGVVSGNQGAVGIGAAAFFSDLGPYGTAVLANGGGGIFGATFELGLGRAVLILDEEIFLNEPSVSGIAAAHLPGYAGVNDTLFLNSFAYVVPQAQVPSPSSLPLVLLGLTALWFFRPSIRLTSTASSQGRDGHV